MRSSLSSCLTLAWRLCHSTTVCTALVWITLAFLTPALPAAGQAPEPPRRPKIGLALGGGGARGGAHVGVLRVLEEMRIPVDMIAGTSMGAVIGGAYASGMSVDEIEEMLESIDWDDLFRSGPRREDLTFRRKEDTRSFSMDVEIGFDGKRFRLPTSLVGGHGLNLLFRTVTLPVSDVQDFDRLPIPYRAVATDIVTGDMVVLGEGDLARAIQASMAVPGAFEPVGIGGRLLVDGGVVRNVPVDVVRQMGADIVVAVDVGSPLLDLEGVQDAFGVLEQTTILLTVQNSRRSEAELGSGDVLIVPELGNMSAADFGRVASAEEAGVEAAESQADALSRLSVSPEEYAPYQARGLPRETSVPVDFMDIVNQTGLSDGVIRALLGIRAGMHVDLQHLLNRLTVLKGAGDLQRVDFRVETRGDQTGLVVTPLDKLWGPSYVRFGVSLKDNIESVSEFGLLSRFTMTRLNRKGAEARAELQIGQTRRVSLEFYQPLDDHLRFFGSAGAEYRSQVDPVFSGDTEVATVRTRGGQAGLTLGSRLGLWGQAKVGVSRQEPRSEIVVGPPGIASEAASVSALIARFVVDELNDPWFPESGVFVGASYDGARSFLGGNVRFDRLGADVSGVFSLGPSSVLVRGEAGTSLGSQLPIWHRFTLGGFGRVSGLQERQLAGNYSGFGSVTYYHRISQPRGLAPVGGFRVGGSLEAGNAWQTTDEISVETLRVGGSLFLGFETLIGPVYFAYGHADAGQDSFYFVLGPPF